MEKTNERRLFSRKPLGVDVIFEDELGEGLIKIRARDISLGGLFLESDIPIRTGSYVFLSFCLPGTTYKIRATGQVVRIIKNEAEFGTMIRQGMGIRFVGLPTEAISAISDFVS